MDEETVYQNIHQDIIDGCVSGDQKSQFKLYKLYYKAMYNASLRIKSLDNIKKKRVELIPIKEQEYRIEDESSNKESGIPEVSVENIKNCINKLADGYRIVLSLYLIEGYDHEEIGQILGISGSTSRSQFTRARKKLIEELKKK